MSKKAPITFTLAGHTFQIKNIRRGIHTEETPDYKADLWADGKYLGEASNNGHGGMTRIATMSDRTDYDLWHKVETDIEKVTKFIGRNDTKYPWHLGEVADELYFLNMPKKTTPKKGLKKFKVGVYLPLSYMTEVWAKNEEEAKETALEEALQTPFNDWDDDYSKAYAELIHDPNAPGLR